MVSNSNIIHTLLWITQILLALLFLTAGGMKTFLPLSEIGEMSPWSLEIDGLFVRLIGTLELAGALGVVLPSLLKIKPKLTFYAALGLLTLMTMATIFHLTRGEYAAITFSLPIALLSAFLVRGRSPKRMPLSA